VVRDRRGRFLGIQLSVCRAFRSRNCDPTGTLFKIHSRGKCRKSTVNEFFLRQTTQTALPAIPQIFEEVRPKPSKAFDHSQIATIHLMAKPNKFADMVAHPLDTGREVKADFRFGSSHVDYSAKHQVNLKISGRETRQFKKLSLRIKFRNVDIFHGRPIVKLRSEVYDPTMTREKLYIDVLNSVGVRTPQGAWVRVYVNRKPFGFFLMVEDVEPPFVLETMHHGSIGLAELGTLYMMMNSKSQEATLQYAGPSAANYDDNDGDPNTVIYKE